MGHVMISRARATTADLPLSPAAEATYEAGARMVKHGALWAMAGLAVTVLCFAVADGTIGHVVAWAGIAFGLVDVVRGLGMCVRARQG
jgi:hypothetical protein